MNMKLGQVAHSRAGDKGNVLTLSLIPLDENDFEWLVATVTEDRVRAHLQDYVKGTVTRYVLPHLKAMTFTCQQALGSGVTTSLRLDAHGKSLSYALLEMEITDRSRHPEYLL